MSNGPYQSWAWDKQIHTVSLASVLFPKAYRGHFAQQTASLLQDDSFFPTLEGLWSAGPAHLIGLHWVSKKGQADARQGVADPLTVTYERQVFAQLHRRLSVLCPDPVPLAGPLRNHRSLRMSFGAASVNTLQLMRRVCDSFVENDIPTIDVKQLPCGWYEFAFHKDDTVCFMQVLRLLGFHHVPELPDNPLPPAKWPRFLATIHLHDMNLQQQLLISSDLDAEAKTLYEVRRRFATAAGATVHSMGKARLHALTELGDNDPFVPSSVEENTFDSDWLHASRYTQKDIRYSVDDAVKRLQTGHEYATRSLGDTVREVCSSVAGNTTLDWLWLRRLKEDEELGVDQVPLNGPDGQMGLDDGELEILKTNNPMGVWPVSVTRPLAKIRLGRLIGRLRSKDWYKNRWMYYPVVFATNTYEPTALPPVNEEALQEALLAATTYAANRTILHEFHGNDYNALCAFQAKLRQIMDECGFSWTPLWLKRDTISLLLKSDSEHTKALSTWARVGSMVHEHLFCQSFFEEEQLDTYDNTDPEQLVNELLAQPDESIPAGHADHPAQQGLLKGKSDEQLFVPGTAGTRWLEHSKCYYMMQEGFHAARLPKPANLQEQYNWSEVRPVDGLKRLGLTYAENLLKGLRLALNQATAMETLFGPMDWVHLSPEVRVKTIAPEYPVAYPFGMSSMGGKTGANNNGNNNNNEQDSDRMCRASGYETRLDDVAIVELYVNGGDSPVATRLALLEYKTRMEMSRHAAEYSNREHRTHFRDVARDSIAAQNYFATIASKRTQLQAETNAWMLYLNTGMLPDFCIVVNTTRRCSPKFAVQDLAPAQPPHGQPLDTSEACVQRPENRANSPYVCGARTIDVGKDNHTLTNNSNLDPEAPANLQVPVPFCIVAIRPFDVRETNLLDLFGKLSFRPFRGKRTGVTAYADRHLLVPDLEATVKQRTKQLHLHSLVETLPTCELSRAVVAALQICHNRFPSPPLGKVTDFQQWVKYITQPELYTVGRHATECAKLRQTLSQLNAFETHDPKDLVGQPGDNANNPNNPTNCTIQIRNSPAEVWTGHQLRTYLASVDSQPLLLASYLAEVAKADEVSEEDGAAIGYPANLLVRLVAGGPGVPEHAEVLAMVLDRSNLNFVPDMDIPMGQHYLMSQGLFRRNCVVPVQRKYPADEQARNAAIRKEWTAWVMHMAQELLAYFEMAMVRRPRSKHATICRRLIEDAAMAQLFHVEGAMLELDIDSESYMTRQLRQATCAAMASMDAEDFYGLTLIAGHRKQLAQLANNLPGQAQEYEDLVIALKRALCKLHASLSATQAHLGANHPNNPANDPVGQHWHWDVLHALHPNEHFGELDQPEHGWPEGKHGFGDVHRFNPIPPNFGVGPRPSAAELVHATGSAGNAGGVLQQNQQNQQHLGNAHRRQWVKGYAQQLGKHKAVSVARMVQRVFNTRVLAAVQAMHGDAGPLVPNYEGDMFDPRGFAHMSQRAYWAQGVIAFCDYRDYSLPPVPQSRTGPPVAVPYWLAEVYKDCVQELMVAATFLPSHAHHLHTHTQLTSQQANKFRTDPANYGPQGPQDQQGQQGQQGQPPANPYATYNHLYSQAGVDVLAEQLARV